MNKLRFKIWALCLVLTGVAAAYLFDRGWSLQTSLESLLPATQTDEGFNSAINAYRARIGKKIIFVISGENWDQIKKNSDLFLAEVQGLKKTVRFQSGQESLPFEKIFELFREKKALLLTASQIQKIEAQEFQEIEHNAIAQLYSPMSGSVSLSNDPLGLSREFYSRLGGFSSFLPRDGYLVRELDNQIHVLLTGEMVDSWKNTKEQNQAVSSLESIAQKMNQSKEVHVRYTGLPFYTSLAVSKSINEISTFGTISVVGIIILFILFFNSIRPLLWSLLVILLSNGIAAVWTEVMLGTIHVFTLVIGSSVVGLIIDYLLHFYFQSFSPKVQTGEDAVRHISSPLFWCWLSTIVGFIALAFAHFPALQQLAIFASIGISFAYLTVIAALPVLKMQKYQPKNYWVDWARIPTSLNRLMQNYSRPLVFVLIFVTALTFYVNKVNDDVSVLQKRPDYLAKQESEIRKITGNSSELSFVAIRANNTQELLQAEESLLHMFSHKNESSSAIAISNWFPSLAKQQQSSTAYSQLENSFDHVLTKAGISKVQKKNLIQNLLTIKNAEPLNIQNELALFNSLPISDQWLGSIKGKSYSIVLMKSEALPTKYGALPNGAEFFVSQTAKDITQVFESARNEMTWIVCIIILLTFIALVYSRSLARAWHIVFPAAIGSALGLSLSGLMLGHLNLFNWLGAILVFFVGIDYPFFYDELDEQTGVPTFVAMLLSWETTILSFGILGLSETQAVQSFGLTLFIGIVISFLLAPMALRRAVVA